MKSLKTIATAASFASVIGLATFGLAPSVANAAPALPGIPWQQDDGHGHGHGHGDWGGDDDWGPGPWWGPPGPAYWGPSACINASGPWGYVSGSACI